MEFQDVNSIFCLTCAAKTRRGICERAVIPRLDESVIRSRSKVRGVSGHQGIPLNQPLEVKTKSMQFSTRSTEHNLTGGVHQID